jgi:hypothetical protein
MPNWVSNQITVQGTEANITAFLAKAGQPYQVIHHGDWVVDENGEKKYDGSIEKHEVNEDLFSYWNFIKPPQEALDSGEYFGTHGWADGKEQGNTRNNWYNWNNREWGVKWDASNIYINGEAKDGKIDINFQSPWGTPQPVYEAIITQHPELEFDFWYEEEQGWGGKFTASDAIINEDGEVDRHLINTDEWDIPESHADYVSRDNEDGCVCSWNDDPEDMYDDCPSKGQATEQAVAEIEEISEMLVGQE